MHSIQKLGLALLSVCLLIPSIAKADDLAVRTNWYAGGAALATFQRDADAEVAGIKDKVNYRAGFGYLGNLGYAWGNGIRTEGEIAYRRSGSVEDVAGDGTTTPVGGRMHNTTFMGNALYDFTNSTRFTPYVGLGIGWDVSSAAKIRTINGTTVDEVRGGFAYQGMAGVAAKLDDRWTALMDYRYLATPDLSYKTDTANKAEVENASHNIMFGLRYSFGEREVPKAVPLPKPAAAPQAAVPAPAPVAAPIVPAVPQSYMVFFDFDRSTLTPEAKRIIAAASAEFLQGKYVRIVVTGHTDTVGTVKYNQKLSLRRAMAVQVELNRLGVPAGVVQAEGAGKSSLLVPTADGVREAQNRRAEIVLNK